MHYLFYPLKKIGFPLAVLLTGELVSPDQLQAMGKEKNSTPLAGVAAMAGKNLKNVPDEWTTLYRGSGQKAVLQVAGRVTDDSGAGLPGVNVLVKGTTVGTSTDQDGRYSLNVPDANAGGTLVFSFIGYVTEEIAIGNRSTIDVSLLPDIASLNEVVVIGYGTQKKEDLTGAISSVNTETISKIATNDVTRAMQGQVAGVSVQGGGEPGAAPRVIIRGLSTLGDATPLYIIDGVQAAINDVPVSEIESMQVLKDASASAIYGSRAANGVVIITTKRGKVGRMRVDYNGYAGVQNIARRYDVTNREEYQLLTNEAIRNYQKIDPAITLAPGNDPGSPSFISNVDTDWQKEALKTGKITEHTLSFSGGSEAATVHTSLNYFDQTGTLTGPAPAYKRYSFNIKSDFTRGKFKFGETLLFSKVDQKFVPFLRDAATLTNIVTMLPTTPVYDPSTVDGFGAAVNETQRAVELNVIGMNNVLTSTTNRYRIIGNVYGEYEIIPGLNYRISGGYERTDWRDFSFQPEHNLGWYFVNNIAKMNDWRGNGSTATFEHTLTFDKTLGIHHITALAGNTVLNAETSTSNGHAEGFQKPYFYSLSQGADQTITNDLQQNRLLSVFGRLIYSLNDKYLLTATIRRDGSSRFARDYRWGNFPSIALGWKIHSEDFMQSVPFISQLKLRASYGEIGNQSVPNYLYSNIVNTYANAVFNGQVAPGATVTTFGTPNLKWETKKSANVGFDFGFLQDRITFSAEYYRNAISDMLVQVRIPELTGVYPIDAPYINGASMVNSGFEFALGYNKTQGAFTYNATANLSTLKNEVTSLGYGDRPIYGYGNMTRTAIGSEVGEFYGWKIERIFQDQAEITALNEQSPTGFYQKSGTAPGDYKFADTNGRDASGKLTGQPDGKVDDDDRVYLGSAIPKVNFGGSFNAAYKNFDFTLSAQGVAGNKIFNAIQASLENGGNYGNFSKDMLNRWTPENPGNDIPRVITYDPNQNARASDRWLESGTYFRLTNLQLGYSLPEALAAKFKLAKLRVYVSGQNVLTFTKYTGFDPDYGYTTLFDRGIDHGNYAGRVFTSYSGGLPNPRTFMAGIQLGL